MVVIRLVWHIKPEVGGINNTFTFNEKMHSHAIRIRWRARSEIHFLSEHKKQDTHTIVTVKCIIWCSTVSKMPTITTFFFFQVKNPFKHCQKL